VAALSNVLPGVNLLVWYVSRSVEVMDELVFWEYVVACAAHSPLHCSPFADTLQDIWWSVGVTVLVAK
jgi:hypothetical protein